MDTTVTGPQHIEACDFKDFFIHFLFYFFIIDLTLLLYPLLQSHALRRVSSSLRPDITARYRFNKQTPQLLAGFQLSAAIPTAAIPILFSLLKTL